MNKEKQWKQVRGTWDFLNIITSYEKQIGIKGYSSLLMIFFESRKYRVNLFLNGIRERIT